MSEKPSEEVKTTSNSDVLDAVKELTSTVADLVEEVASLREEMALKKRAGVFDQSNLPKEKK